jgi:hypothetical protein
MLNRMARDSAPDVKSRDTQFESQISLWIILTETFCDFPQFLQKNKGTGPSNRLRRHLSKSLHFNLPIHHNFLITVNCM